MRRFAPILAVALLLACDPDVPSEPPVMEGVVVAVSGTTVEGAVIHVKHPPTEECGVRFRTDDDTHAFRRVAHVVDDVSPETIRVGSRVRVWASLVLDSCPGESYASAIQLLDYDDVASARSAR